MKILPILLLLSSCSLLSSERELYLNFPDLPEGYEELVVSWKIVIASQGGQEAYSFSAEKRGTNFTQTKGDQLLALCWGVTRNGVTLKPAGAILNDQIRGSLAFDYGASVTLLYQLWARGMLPEEYNSVRLCREMADRAEITCWEWDLDRASTDVVEGDFSVYSLKRSEVYEVTLPLGYSWLSEDPNRGPAKESTYLPSGLHRFFAQNGSICEMVISDRGEWATIVY